MVAEQNDPTGSAPAETQLEEPDVTYETSDDGDLSEDVEELRNMVKQLRKKLKEAKERKPEITAVKGYDTKTAIKPGQWEGSAEEYKVWSVKYVAYMKAMDKQWKTILNKLKEYSSGQIENNLLDDDKVKKFMEDNGIDSSLKEELQETMFISLLEYTGGDVRSRVHGMGENGVFQAYRWVHHKGTNLDVKQKIDLRSAVMNPESAETVDEVEQKVLKWKADIGKLIGVDSQAVTTKDRVQPYWSIMPEKIQDYLMNRGFSPSDWDNYDKVETEVEGFLRRWNLKTKKSGKSLQSVNKQDEEEDKVVEWQWCDYYNDFIATKSLNMAVKRQRIDDGERGAEGKDEQEGEREEKGKGEGKTRRKGPVTGCYECKGDHYASECPNLQFSRNQWRDLKPALYPKQPWNNLYEPIQQSWKGKGKSKGKGYNNQWHGGKGKAKGKCGKGAKGGKGGMMDVNSMMGNWSWMDFPPLNGMCQGESNGWSEQEWGHQSGYLMALSRGERKRNREKNRVPSELVDGSDDDEDEPEDKYPPELVDSSDDEEDEPEKEYDITSRDEGSSDEEVEEVPMPVKFKICGAKKGKKRFMKTNAFNECLHGAKSYCCINRWEAIQDGPGEGPEENMTGHNLIKRPADGHPKPDMTHELLGKVGRINRRRVEGEDFEKVTKEYGEIVKVEKTMALLEKSMKGDIGVISGRKGGSDWKRLSLAVDSGAFATVASPEDLPDYDIEETDASKAGETFVSASGDAIPNLGDMKVPLITREKTKRLMTITAAPVTKPLASVKQLCRTGHIVVFDDDASYVYNKHSGEVNMLREENGNYMLDCWVPPSSSPFGGHP